jgi:hypothetical protein
MPDAWGAAGTVYGMARFRRSKPPLEDAGESAEVAVDVLEEPLLSDRTKVQLALGVLRQFLHRIGWVRRKENSSVER